MAERCCPRAHWTHTELFISFYSPTPQAPVSLHSLSPSFLPSGSPTSRCPGSFFSHRSLSFPLALYSVRTGSSSAQLHTSKNIIFYFTFRPPPGSIYICLFLSRLSLRCLPPHLVLVLGVCSLSFQTGGSGWCLRPAAGRRPGPAPL